MSSVNGMSRSSKNNAIYIIGLGHEYPPHSVRQEHFEDFLQRLCPDEVTSPAIQKLIQFNKKTKIVSRPTILDYAGWTKENTAPPDVDSISRMFRTEGVQLTTSACKEAMREACLEPGDITHTVAVTCTDQSNPGYDLFVCQELGLGPNVQRVLLHGVGCAGGLSALRAAASIAAAASQRGRHARILVMACEICSLSFQAEVQAACEDEKLHVAPALFSDGAAALAVCNGLALADRQKPVFELNDWDSVVVPGTSSYISYDIEKHGMIATISKHVPGTAIDAILPLFDRLRATLNTTHVAASVNRSPASNFDWAIHPGGATILQGAKQALQLNDDHIRASLDVYHNYGNSSSPTVLIVLDKLRRMGEGRENIVATSFGPGVLVEMCLMRRCRQDATASSSSSSVHTKMYTVWLSLHSRLSKRWTQVQPRAMKGIKRRTSGYASIVH